ncbi:MAG TPA: MBL fold metallo-hydrolase [Spirochaetota bacterium]|nr:MBL fold metallo-hydrolase [Spirochaetota bacterium]HOM38689.1 MBL fold metallo-hydrolase [Spirochaetota bacterium]HPQ49795.1 MBL fold metallo-hydrolase [Spirochaetota bacterium]
MEIYGIFIYWLGHASFLIKVPLPHSQEFQSKDKKEIIIYIDPYDLKPGKNYPKADIIFISHTHYDHFSPNDVKTILKENTIIVGPYDIKDIASNTIKLSPNESNTVAINNYKLVFTGVPAYNKTKQFHPKANKWLGYVIELNGKKIYHTGDSEFVEEMRKIKTDIVFVPVGGTYTMDFKEAADLVNTIKPEYAIPMHWGTVVGNKDDALRFKELVDKEIKVLILDRY